MSIADYLEDGADYYEAYHDDCDGDCKECEIKHECEESDYSKQTNCFQKRTN